MSFCQSVCLSVCLCMLLHDVNFFSSFQGVLLGPLEQNGLKRVRQYIFIYVLIALIALMPPLEAFVFFSVTFCRMYALVFEKKRGACGPSPIGDTHSNLIYIIVLFCSLFSSFQFSMSFWPEKNKTHHRL